MKILLICSSDIMAIPAALTLQSAGLLSAIAIPAKHKERLLLSFMQAGFEKKIIHTVSKETLADELAALLKHTEADMAMVITFPWKIPRSILALVPNGCFNFHPGLLPKYKGSDPIFWQIRNRETKAGLTVHLMTDEMDGGPIVMVQELALLPGETYGIHAQRIALLIADTILKAIDTIEQSAGSFSKQQPSPQLTYHKKPGFEDLHINWSMQTAAEIDALVNASNPKYNGAITTVAGRQMHILEISIANLNNPPNNALPGEIVYADSIYGPVVCCINGEFVKINTVCMEEGFLSGTKLFSLGIDRGKYLV